ncbi:MAG: hypothetical protein JNM96_09090, partial [Bacteroidia bacterium]|nr:hypothetical protein [Bacteroidia bacterium]
MKKIILMSALILNISAIAQKGKDFPAIVGATLENKGTSLPTKNGKETIVAIAFHRAAEDE